MDRVSALPSEEALRDMRGVWAGYAAKVGRGGTNVGVEMTPDTQLALLDCALLVRRMERCMADPARCDSFEHHCRIIASVEWGQMEPSWLVSIEDPRRAYGYGPDLLTALAAALTKAEAGK